MWMLRDACSAPVAVPCWHIPTAFAGGMMMMSWCPAWVRLPPACAPATPTPPSHVGSAVLSLDDDIMMPCQDLERGFASWRMHPEKMVR